MIRKINLPLFSSIKKTTGSHFSTSKKYTGSIDQSTTGTKFSLFQLDGTLVDQQIIPHQQISLHQGWLEHNPSQIISSVQKAISNVLQRQNQKDILFKIQNIIGIGLCNQRETVVCWDRKTGQPLHNAIVWSDSRTADVCSRFSQKYGEFKKVTGLPVSTYFTLFKILWILQENKQIKEKMKRNEVYFGTIDAWVAYSLTGQFVTDASNASRTHLCDISNGKWAQSLLYISQISQSSLPQIVNSFQDIGPIKQGGLKGVHLRSILGDQQSSAFAHNISQQQMKITYGTGCFMMNNMGQKPHFHDAFVTTILWEDNKLINFGYQASIECGGGTINWAKRLGLFSNYNELNTLPECPEELMFLPSFGSIYSPFWKPNTAGHFLGLGFNTTRQHMLQSILEGITFRIYDNIKSKEFENIHKVIVDGGLCQNRQFMQMNADLFNKEIEVRTLDTCWGVAKGAIKSSGMQVEQRKFQSINFYPTANKTQYFQHKYKAWDNKRNQMYNI